MSNISIYSCKNKQTNKTIKSCEKYSLFSFKKQSKYFLCTTESRNLEALSFYCQWKTIQHSVAYSSLHDFSGQEKAPGQREEKKLTEP